MSRDMLSYEPGEIERYGWTKARIRLYLLRLVQNRSLKRSDGVIFFDSLRRKNYSEIMRQIKKHKLYPSWRWKQF